MRGSPDMIEVPGAPPVEGLRFRRFEGDADYATMSRLGGRSFEADGIDYFETEEDLRHDFQESPSRDPYAEVIFAEVKGTPVACARTWIDPGDGGEFEYWHAVHLVPEWRKTELRRALLRYNERQIVARARGAGVKGALLCKLWALDEPSDWRALVISEGYTAVLFFYEMVRRDLDDIPDAPFPEGLEVRPAEPSEYPKIWSASKEAFRGKPWFVEALYGKEQFDSWASSPENTPELWRVAWDSAEIAGMARNDIPRDQNRAYGRSRGHTQHLSVMPKWRRRGLGRALLAESLRMMRDMGLKEASLDVETQSTTGEVDLYLSMGYEINRKYAHFAKHLTERGLRGERGRKLNSPELPM